MDEATKFCEEVSALLKQGHGDPTVRGYWLGYSHAVLLYYGSSDIGLGPPLTRAKLDLEGGADDI